MISASDQEMSGNVRNTINGSRHQIQNHCKQDKNPVQQAFFSFQRALVEWTYSRNQCTQIEIPNTTNGIRVTIQQCTQVCSRAQNTNRQEVVTEPANLLQQPAANEMMLSIDIHIEAPREVFRFTLCMPSVHWTSRTMNISSC